ncbi:MAG: hypothetical protein J0M12_04475 [Deltaproteobacteria bacterium]|nr:hypothetical protein [Deltaproteobacteria bacterium]
MNALHSFWFKPFLETQGSRSLGGFSAPRYFWYSWVLSFNTIYNRYPKTILVTDKFGRAEVERLGLPYDEIHSDLEELQIRPGFWNAGKFLAYAIQKEPFFHLDIDAFMWNVLPERLLQASVFGQSVEREEKHRIYYRDALKVVRSRIPDLPARWGTLNSEYTNGYALNCGIFGGTNLPLIQEYANEALDFMNAPRYAALWQELASRTALPTGGGMGIVEGCAMVFEQLGIVLRCEEAGITPQVLIEQPLPDDSYPPELGYTHLISVSKRLPLYLNALEARIARDLPNYKQLIDQIYGSQG